MKTGIPWQLIESTMKLVLLCFSIVFISLVNAFYDGKYSANKTRPAAPLGIINGKKASIKNFPYTVAIYYEDAMQGSGVILSKRWVLTTAYLVNWVTADEITLRVGSDYYSKGGQSMTATKVVVHSKYTGSWDYDIAVVKTAKSIKFGSKVKAVSLGKKDLKSGLKIPIAGWGPTSVGGVVASEDLLYTKVTVISRTKCTTSYPSDMTKRIMCTLDKKTGPCYQDFGSGLVVKDAVYGLYSGGYNCESSPMTYPALYTDVASLHAWVSAAIKN